MYSNILYIEYASHGSKKIKVDKIWKLEANSKKHEMKMV